MRISELSASSGITVPTIKFYLREGLLAPGSPRAVNQADYGEPHLHRLRLIRALSEIGGLRLREIRGVLAAIDDDRLAAPRPVGGSAVRPRAAGLHRPRLPHGRFEGRCRRGRGSRAPGVGRESGCACAREARAGAGHAPPVRLGGLRAGRDSLWASRRRLGRDGGPVTFHGWAARRHCGTSGSRNGTFRGGADGDAPTGTGASLRRTNSACVDRARKWSRQLSGHSGSGGGTAPDSRAS